MDVWVEPGCLSGAVRIPSSKSILHRALICAALSSRETKLHARGLSEDAEATINCLKALGAAFQLEDLETLLVTPPRARKGHAALACGESASTLRFLLPVAPLLAEKVSFSGAESLGRRPHGPLIAQLKRHGCIFSADTLPFSARGRISPGIFLLPGDISSQFITGLMLALPLLEGDSEIRLTTPLESTAYVRLTETVLAMFGVAVSGGQGRYAIPGGQTYASPGQVWVEGDWSCAAPFLLANEWGGRVEVQGLLPDSLQADMAFRAKHGEMARQGHVDVAECPDLFPLLAIAACALRGRIRLTGAKRLRYKESDRIRAMARMIRAMGGAEEEEPDALTVLAAGGLRGGTVNGCGDHRVVMAAAIAAMICEDGVRILGAEAVQKSYPGFWDEYGRLGGKVHAV